MDSDSELDEDGEDFATRHLTQYQLIPPEGVKGYEHAVRKEPFSASKICGYLDTGAVVQVEADCGDWLKVRAHRKAISKLTNSETNKKEKKDKEIWGWCVRHSDGHDYLVKLHDTIHENDDEDEDSDKDPTNINDFGVHTDDYEGVWYEMEDEEGITV